MDRREYTAQVLSCLCHVTWDEREAIRAELDGHMEDHFESLRELGYDETEAEERTLAAMGDPAEVGRELDRQYPFRWLIVKWAAWLLAAWALLLILLNSVSVMDAQESPVTAVLERLQPDLSHHFAPSGTVEAERQPDIEFPLGNDIVRVVRVCVYSDIPWGERKAYINVDSYDRYLLGAVSVKELVLESQDGSREQIRVSGENQWWYTGSGEVLIGEKDTYVTLRCEAYGESHAVQIPLPEEELP